MFDLGGMIGNYEDRKVGRWDDESGSRMVSTAFVTDGRKPYETAVQHPDYNEGKMVIVECYDTRKAATKGHAKWLDLVLAEALPPTLVDCANAELGQFLEEIGGTMAFEKKIG